MRYVRASPGVTKAGTQGPQISREICVSGNCCIPSHMASEHLRLMQRCGFMTSEKDGRKAYYQIAETPPGLTS